MTVLPPGSVIGILGGGQLGRMLAMAAARLGLHVHIYSDHSGPAFDVAGRSTLGDFEDLAAIRKWAAAVDVVTYEFENVPLAAAHAAAEIRPVRPGVRALDVAQDRLVEKSFLSGLGLPVAPFLSVDGAEDLATGVAEVGLPSILKSRRLGYDGKGQVRLKDASELAGAWNALGCVPAILEGFVGFDCEVSVILVRGLDGAAVAYDVPLNTHVDGILSTSTVPGPLAGDVAAEAVEIARRIAAALDYVGVLAVEMFDLGPDAQHRLVVNEIAPRVHNSGHWTMDACTVSQFENHIRAVCGWPLGATDRHADATMTNLIGCAVEAWPTLAAEADACLHLYGKRDARPGRKMGHVNRIRALGAGKKV